MGFFFRKEEISEEKKELLKKGKELSLNLDPKMSELEMRKRIGNTSTC